VIYITTLGISFVVFGWVFAGFKGDTRECYDAQEFLGVILKIVGWLLIFAAGMDYGWARFTSHALT
jgi:hypothetical protein